MSYNALEVTYFLSEFLRGDTRGGVSPPEFYFHICRMTGDGNDAQSAVTGAVTSNSTRLQKAKPKRDRGG